MELRQLEHFVAVAEERHFTRAASRVGIVQSGLSESVRSLERELGIPLFERNKRGIELTTAGEALLPEALRALAAAESGREAVGAVARLGRGRLVVGLAQDVTPRLAPVSMVASRAALHDRRTTTPKTRDGLVESLRVPRLTRSTAVKSRRAALMGLGVTLGPGLPPRAPEAIRRPAGPPRRRQRGSPSPHVG